MNVKLALSELVEGKRITRIELDKEETFHLMSHLFNIGDDKISELAKALHDTYDELAYLRGETKRKV